MASPPGFEHTAQAGPRDGLQTTRFFLRRRLRELRPSLPTERVPPVRELMLPRAQPLDRAHGRRDRIDGMSDNSSSRRTRGCRREKRTDRALRPRRILDLGYADHGCFPRYCAAQITEVPSLDAELTVCAHTFI